MRRPALHLPPTAPAHPFSPATTRCPRHPLPLHQRAPRARPLPPPRPRLPPIAPPRSRQAPSYTMQTQRLGSVTRVAGQPLVVARPQQPIRRALVARARLHKVRPSATTIARQEGGGGPRSAPRWLDGRRSGRGGGGAGRRR